MSLESVLRSYTGSEELVSEPLSELLSHVPDELSQLDTLVRRLDNHIVLMWDASWEKMAAVPALFTLSQMQSDLLRAMERAQAELHYIQRIAHATLALSSSLTPESNAWSTTKDTETGGELTSSKERESKSTEFWPSRDPKERIGK